MLDVLAELLIELFTGKPARKSQQRQANPQRRPGQPLEQQRQDGWPEPSADDPYRKEGHAGDNWMSLSLEDLVKKMSGRDDSPEPPPPPNPVRAPQPDRQSVAAVAKPAAQSLWEKVERLTEQERRETRARQATVPATSPASEIAAKLHNNPQAARDALVFAEIFGRPLGERDGFR